MPVSWLYSIMLILHMAELFMAPNLSQMSCLEYMLLPSLLQPISHNTPSAKASMKSLMASSCRCWGSEYVATPCCWSRWWTERKHSHHRSTWSCIHWQLLNHWWTERNNSHHLHYNFSHSSLSCSSHCHWNSSLYPRLTCNCSHRHMIKVERNI